MNQTKISTRLLLGFSLTLLGALIVAGIGLFSVTHLSRIVTDIHAHPFVVSNTITGIRADVLLVQSIVGDMEHAANSAEIERLRLQLLELRAAADKDVATVRRMYLGPKSDVDDIASAWTELRAARDETINLMLAGRTAEAIAKHGKRDSALMETVLKRVDVVRNFAFAKAAELEQQARDKAQSAVRLVSIAFIVVLVGGFAMTLLIMRSVKQSLQQASTTVQKLIEGSGDKVRVAEAISAGDLGQEPVLSEPLQLDLNRLPNDEIGTLIRAASRMSEIQCALDEAFHKMTLSLRQDREAVRALDWLKSGQNELNALMRGEQGVAEMSNRVLAYLADYLKAGVGALYLFDEHRSELYLAASYACTPRKNAGDRLGLGEGLVGQAAREKKVIVVSGIPPDYLPIGSALGESAPKAVSLIPLMHGKRLVGVIEMGSFREFDRTELEFLERAREGIAIGLDMTLARHAMAELLEETQQQTEELRVQQEELQQSSEELEERAQLLEQQRDKIRSSNERAEAANQKLQQQAEELGRISNYKSEFLANMSHELRTPLNSLMILSNLLTQNKEGNLTEKQVEFAATIHNAGKDLLNLISDILDLSKIESGHMQMDYAEVSTGAMCDALQALFTPVARQKNLSFHMCIEADAPPAFRGDEQRIRQILKNLVSNALKFTAQGEVALRVFAPAGHENPLPVRAVAFAVSDTGIGIPADKQKLIFQAFQQADGSISRKYGGTGLGLSISLQLARAMHGDVQMRSLEGGGSVFTLYLPFEETAAQFAEPGTNRDNALSAETKFFMAVQGDESAYLSAPVPDDRDHLKPGDKSILVIEDDLDFAGILREMINKRGFAVLAAANGESGVALAERYAPSAIILDVALPHIDGWRVMRHLKDNPRTRHIPVHFITCMDDRHQALVMGAIGFVTKPVSAEQLDKVFQTIEGSIDKTVKRLLIVEDNASEAKSMVALLEEAGVEITVVASGEEAIPLLASGTFDCMVLDLGLSDMSGFDLLARVGSMEGTRRIPVIIHSGRELSHEDERKLRRHAESIVIKGVRSPERLLNEVTLFLHLVESELHPDKQRMIRTALDREAMLDGRKVLLVDDDMRNVFSLSSVLAEKSMQVIEAENGVEALARLNEHSDIAVVLMDIMMPEMDGYTAMRAIRKDPRFADLPIIAMTAKALKGDHEKCLEAGASDYIAKPVDMEKLFSLIRVWTFQRA
ncbi:MAG: response regulator [Sideroxyarcus sp.]|nr:response regulator [Sideroxyarcus sp.]